MAFSRVLITVPAGNTGYVKDLSIVPVKLLLTIFLRGRESGEMQIIEQQRGLLT